MASLLKELFTSLPYYNTVDKLFHIKKIKGDSTISTLENIVDLAATTTFDSSLVIKGATIGALLVSPYLPILGLGTMIGAIALGTVLFPTGTRLIYKGLNYLASEVNNNHIQPYAQTLTNEKWAKFVSGTGNFLAGAMSYAVTSGGSLSFLPMLGLSGLTTYLKKKAHENSADVRLNTTYTALSFIPKLIMGALAGFSAYNNGSIFSQWWNYDKSLLPASDQPTIVASQTPTLTPTQLATVIPSTTTPIPTYTSTVTVTPTPVVASNVDYNSYFGGTWGDADSCKAVEYAKNMHIPVVFYNDKMLNCGFTKEDLAGLSFVIESPENRTGIGPYSFFSDRQYSSDEITLYNWLYAQAENHLGKPFPLNLGYGYWLHDNEFRGLFDYQNPEVRAFMINHILDYMAKAEEKGFNIVGIAEDVPDLSDDAREGFKQDRIEFNNAFYPDGAPSGAAPTHQDGRALFFTELYAAYEKKFGEPIKLNVPEPTKIQNWANETLNRPDFAQLNPPGTLICQEGSSTDFLEQNLPWTNSQMCHSSPDLNGYSETLASIGPVAVHGAYSNWFGRVSTLEKDGSGFDPRDINKDGHVYIEDLNPQTKIVKIIPNYENALGVPLEQRIWQNGIYSSPFSYAGSDMVYTTQPGSFNIYATIMNQTAAGIIIPNMPVSITWTDELMGPAGDATGSFNLALQSDGSYLLTPLNADALNKGFIIDYTP